MNMSELIEQFPSTFVDAKLHYGEVICNEPFSDDELQLMFETAHNVLPTIIEKQQHTSPEYALDESYKYGIMMVYAHRYFSEYHNRLVPND